MRLAAFALVSALCLGGLAEAQEEVAPEFGALQGAELSHFLTRRFDAYKMPIGRFTRDEQPVEVIEGAVREFVYKLEGEASTLEAIRNYQGSFGRLGYETLFECSGDECGGFDFRFNIYLVEPPAMRFDLADFRYLALGNADGKRYASVIASRQGGALFVQIIAIQGEANAPDQITGEKNAPPPQAKPEQAGLYALARGLTEEGHAPLDGIDFEAGSAKLTEASGPILDQIATILRERPDLRFLVVGHTDNQGGLQTNLDLSLERAKAVADRISKAEGVSPGQLAPYGVGFLSPRASNATAEGRALNRRVELVLE